MRTIISLKSNQYVISMQGGTTRKLQYSCNPKKEKGKNLEKVSQIGFQLRSSEKTFRARTSQTAEENHNMF